MDGGSGAYSYEINLKVFLINKTIFKSNNLKLDSSTTPHHGYWMYCSVPVAARKVSSQVKVGTVLVKMKMKQEISESVTSGNETSLGLS